MRIRRLVGLRIPHESRELLNYSKWGFVNSPIEAYNVNILFVKGNLPVTETERKYLSSVPSYLCAFLPKMGKYERLVASV